MATFNMNTMTSYSHLLGSSTKIPMLILEFYDQWADCMEEYLNGIDEDLWKCIVREFHPPAVVQSIGTNVAEHAKKLLKMKRSVYVNSVVLFHKLYTIMYVAVKLLRRFGIL